LGSAIRCASREAIDARPQVHFYYSRALSGLLTE
jgi:hypothetical protein